MFTKFCATVSKISLVLAVMGPVYDKFMTTPEMKRAIKAIQDTK